MNEYELNSCMLTRFPELEEAFERYTSWQDGMHTGCFLTFEDLLLPLAIEAVRDKNKPLLTRIGSFIEELMTSGDDYSVNVATVGMLEGLKASGGCPADDFLGPTSLKEYNALEY